MDGTVRRKPPPRPTGPDATILGRPVPIRRAPRFGPLALADGEWAADRAGGHCQWRRRR
jgi:hypothetical protein